MLVTADCDEVLSQTPITLPDDGGHMGMHPERNTDGSIPEFLRDTTTGDPSVQ
nr:hypothetical protein [Clostridia bacterium]